MNLSCYFCNMSLQHSAISLHLQVCENQMNGHSKDNNGWTNIKKPQTCKIGLELDWQSQQQKIGWEYCISNHHGFCDCEYNDYSDRPWLQK